MSTGNVAPSASMDEAPVRQNFFARPAIPLPVSAPPMLAGMVAVVGVSDLLGVSKPRSNL